MKKYYIGNSLVATGDSRLGSICKELFSGFCFGKSTLSLIQGKENTLLIGDTSIPKINSSAEFALKIDENGIAINGRDYGSLMRGFFSMLMKIRWDFGKEELFLEEVTENTEYKLKNRMVHLCLFPEADLYSMKKYIRLLAVLQFTHVVIEPWGTVRLDCLPELGWKNSFSKNDLSDLVNEIKVLGMEPIPMFNSLGHASGARYMSGKHVVLDQNPSLYYLFTPDGWAWDLENEKTWTLLKSIRKELYEIFDDCSYFHIGFDESHSHNKNEILRPRLSSYLKRLTDEIAREGKRPMLWIDMLLPAQAYNGFKANCHSVRSEAECTEILSKIHKSAIFVDWQYDVTESPISTSLYYKDKGLDIIGAPWLNPKNGKAHIDTVSENGLFGVMLTTWHTLFKEIDNLIPFTKEFGGTLPWFYEGNNATTVAALLRNLMPWDGNYEHAGYSKRQLDN